MENYREVSKGIFLTDDGLMHTRTDDKMVLEYLNKNFNANEVEEIKKLAIDLHTLLCDEDHTGYCSWYYEIKDNDIHDWTRCAHLRYLIKAYNCYVSKITIDMIKHIKRVTEIA